MTLLNDGALNYLVRIADNRWKTIVHDEADWWLTATSGTVDTTIRWGRVVTCSE